MEQETTLKEILNALKLHGEKMDERFEGMENRLDNMESRFDTKIENLNSKMDKMDKRFDRLDKKVGGIRVDLTETQETSEFVLSKTTQHEKKLRQLSEQYQ